jgi:hypothetical protein
LLNSIQCSKNKNLKTKISRITNHILFVFIYKKRDGERNKKKRRDKGDRKNKNKNSIISTLNVHNF